MTISGFEHTSLKDKEGRLIILEDLALRLADRRDDLVAAAADDMGAPYTIAGIEVDLAVGHLRYLESEWPLVAGKQPYGVVAAIFPYDAAPVMLARVAGAAILGGNTFRFSCSSQTPRTAQVLGEVVAPFPEITLVQGMDNHEFGQRCVDDPQVRAFFLSGGGEVGQIYARQAHAFDKLFFAGPGGMPQMIIFQDASLEHATRFTVRRAFLNGGQYCTCIKRAFIHRDIYPEAKRLILQQMREIKVGRPQDPDTWIGPILVKRTRVLLDRALETLTHGNFLLPPRRDGVWQGPFLLETDDPPDAELFGPFLALTPVADDAEALARVLQTQYPFLAAWFGTAPPGAKDAMADKFGMVYDNPDFLFTPLQLPFGGKGLSGWILERRGDDMIKRDGAFTYSVELVSNEGG
jgi:acyl-CoA reductase-like NAD-dependent aldehyde dehydrogenase